MPRWKEGLGKEANTAGKPAVAPGEPRATRRAMGMEFGDEVEWPLVSFKRLNSSDPFFCSLMNTDPTGLDVWIENGNSAGGFHRRICVDTWDDKRSKKTGKLCISFAGGGSDLCTFRSCDSCDENSDSKRCASGYSTCPVPLPSEFPYNEHGNGVIYEDTGSTTKERWRYPYTCKEDKRIAEYFRNLIGTRGDYGAFIGTNCRDFSEIVWNFIPPTVDDGWGEPVYIPPAPPTGPIDLGPLFH
jgi:hypothetical protein